MSGLAPVLALLALNAPIATPATSMPASGPAVTVDTFPDTWAATDALGRTLPPAEQVGPPRDGKYVGIFYFLWSGQHGTDGPYDVTKILAQDPGAMLKPNSPLWGPEGHFHHWGESLFGYYLSDDAWVLSKHAQMLADAGVDTVIFDVTNQITYQKVYMRLCEVFAQARRNGRKTPQIAFLTPFWDPSRVVADLYKNLYKPGLYRDLWFQWKGKPLILADPAKAPAECRDFFTFRNPQPDYFQGPTGPDQWGWLEIYPQHAFYNRAGKPEQMTVGIGQNATGRRLCAFSEKNTYGRSWHDGRKDERPDAVNLGLNVSEQWERALKIDPEFVFITGWNEWIAIRMHSFNGVHEPVMLVDQFTQEYSRDIEPMKGGHGDDYYYQMVSYIRRFKGIRKPPAASGPKTIRIDGDFSDWAEVQPEYRDDLGDTMHRDHPGYDKVGRYTNNTGRNDLVVMKVARDDSNVYFYARTAAPMTPSTDPHWMMLFIDTDPPSEPRAQATGHPSEPGAHSSRPGQQARPEATGHRSGWEGFDLLVNRRVKNGEATVVETTPKGWDWQSTTEAPYRVRGNELELALPRSLFKGAPWAGPRFRFKWADNMVREGDMLDFTVDGDAAPNGRFCYTYE